VTQPLVQDNGARGREQHKAADREEDIEALVHNRSTHMTWKTHFPPLEQDTHWGIPGIELYLMPI